VVQRDAGGGLAIRFGRVYDGFELAFILRRQARRTKMGKAKLSRRDFVLAALAPAEGEAHTPVQVQKLMFILEQELPTGICEPGFDFRPYDYGPFDKQVYEDLEALAAKEWVDIRPGPWRTYRLTVKGQERGETCLRKLPEHLQEYIRKISGFARRLSFTQLVSAVYKKYPWTRERSVFQE
jgi:hypothetical protein